MQHKKWFSLGIGLAICAPFLSTIDNYKEIKVSGSGNPGQTEIMVHSADDSIAEKHGRLGYWVQDSDNKWYIATSTSATSASGMAYFENTVGLQPIGKVVHQDSLTGLALIDTSLSTVLDDYIPSYEFHAEYKNVRIIDYVKNYEEIEKHKDNLYLYAGETNKLINVNFEGYMHGIGFVINDKDRKTPIHNGDVGSPIFYYDEEKSGYIYIGSLWEKSHLSEWKYLMTTILNLPDGYIPYTAKY